MEIAYAVFMSWGYANIALGWKTNYEYCFCSIIATYVLIRFFFAPAHNLRTLAIELRDRPFWQRVLFIVDIPVLMLHSFIFYMMCDSTSKGRYEQFYILFFFLLSINVIWLLTIQIRMIMFKKPTLSKFSTWTTNNALHYLLFGYLWVLCRNVILISPFVWLFLIALSNCLVDFIITAPVYLGFNKKS